MLHLDEGSTKIFFFKNHSCSLYHFPQKTYMVRMSAADAAGVDTEPDDDAEEADIIGVVVFGSIPRARIPALILELDAKFHSFNSV